MKKLLLIMMAVLGIATVQAKKDRIVRVYMFGVAANLNDSTVYVTDIQVIDSAFVTKSGLLPERAIYSFQLQNYLEEKQSMANMTTAVVWGTKLKTVNKSYNKIRRRYAKDTASRIAALPGDGFAFTRVEHFEESTD